jgi:hypothetical protein
LSTATALLPSAIIWGVLLDMKHGHFPKWQGYGGCLLYLVAVIGLIVSRPEGDSFGNPGQSLARRA